MVKYKTVRRACDHCAVDYDARCFSLAKGMGRFCSVDCSNKATPQRYEKLRAGRASKNIARLRGPIATKTGDVFLVPLAGSGGRGYALIDAADRDLVGQYAWKLSVWQYAIATVRANGIARCVSMHRLVADPPADLAVDHINQTRLDNRRCNLRPATVSENGFNSVASWGRVPVKGVWMDQEGRFVTHIRKSGRTVFFRKFDNLADATAAALEARRQLSGLHSDRVARAS